VEIVADSTDAGNSGLILHVDDEQQVRDSLALVLGGTGYVVARAASGPAAMQLVAEGFKPDVLIADYNLDHEMNGADVAQQLRRELGYSPPIIMLTGNPTDAELPWITDAPMWLARKPLDPRLLLAALPGLVQVSRSMRAVHGPQSA
jgi:two-component system, chemotaxis family, CheB/CheR fusion protein